MIRSTPKQVRSDRSSIDDCIALLPLHPNLFDGDGPIPPPAHRCAWGTPPPARGNVPTKNGLGPASCYGSVGREAPFSLSFRGAGGGWPARWLHAPRPNPSILRERATATLAHGLAHPQAFSQHPLGPLSPPARSSVVLGYGARAPGERGAGSSSTAAPLVVSGLEQCGPLEWYDGGAPGRARVGTCAPSNHLVWQASGRIRSRLRGGSSTSVAGFGCSRRGQSNNSQAGPDGMPLGRARGREPPTRHKDLTKAKGGPR